MKIFFLIRSQCQHRSVSILSVVEGLISLGVSILIITKNIYAEEEKNLRFGAISLEPITVTASRRERKVTNVSSSVSIISENQIKYSNAKSIPDLVKNLEGVYTYDSSGVGTAGTINMRGFWGNMSTHQLVLIDGVPQNKGKDKLVGWDSITLDNIERIEILRGPASALYGDNAMSGVINIITKKPTQKPTISLSGSLGTYNTQDYATTFSGVFKKLGFYFNASKKSTDGFRRHCSYAANHFNSKLDFSFDETQNLDTSFSYHWKERGAYPWAITEAQIEERGRREARPGTENDKERSQKVDFSTIYNKKIEEMLSASGTFYYRHEDSESYYTSGSTASSTKEQLWNENTYGLPLLLDIKTDIFGMNNSFVTGLDLEINDFKYKEYKAPYQIRKGDVVSDYDVVRFKVGPYFQDEINITDVLKFIAGIRYDLITFDFLDRNDNSDSEKKSMSKMTPNCGIVYTYWEDSNLYASYGQAFRTPTIGQMFTYGSSSNINLLPEEAANYEIGMRLKLNDYVKTNASLYWMGLDSEIWYDYAERIYQNYGKTSHRGIETALYLKIIEGLTTFVNYTYTRAQNSNGDYKGKYLTNIPINKGGLGLKMETKYGLEANLMLTNTGFSYIDSENNDKLPSYSTLDFNITYEYKWYSVFLSIENLLDKKFNVYGYKSGTTKYFNPAPGRTFTAGIGINYKF